MTRVVIQRSSSSQGGNGQKGNSKSSHEKNSSHSSGQTNETLRPPSNTGVESSRTDGFKDGNTQIRPDSDSGKKDSGNTSSSSVTRQLTELKVSELNEIPLNKTSESSSRLKLDKSSVAAPSSSASHDNDQSHQKGRPTRINMEEIPSVSSVSTGIKFDSGSSMPEQVRQGNQVSGNLRGRKKNSPRTSPPDSKSTSPRFKMDQEGYNSGDEYPSKGSCSQDVSDGFTFFPLSINLLIISKDFIRPICHKFCHSLCKSFLSLSTFSLFLHLSHSCSFYTVSSRTSSSKFPKFN